MTLDRIAVDRIMGGVPCIGSRMPVSRIITTLAAEMTVQDVVDGLSQLTAEVSTAGPAP